MTRRRWRVGLLVLVIAWPGTPARGEEILPPEVKLDVFGDVRVLRSGDEKSWRDGGLGKFRYGGHDIEPTLGELSGVGRVQLAPELSAYAHARVEPDQRSAVDLIEAYFRYRPVSTSPLRWSVKAGAFFPPISLENDGIGWTTPWTLTPSAINSWVGEELRTIGGEGTVEWRGDGWSLEGTAALYGVNDPAGILLAERGWAFGDRPTGLFDRNRLPDATLRPGMRAPLYSVPYQEIDGRVGWYTGVAAKRDGVGRVSLLYYNNEADGSATTGQYAWHTDFWAGGIETDLEPWVLKAQLMVGATDFAPLGVNSHTDFAAAYVLVGYDFGAWRLAGRGDWFRTDGYAPRNSVSYEEHGYAATVALSWLPRPWLRITGEVLYVDSTREQRQVVGVPENARDTQVQLSFRLFY